MICKRSAFGGKVSESDVEGTPVSGDSLVVLIIWVPVQAAPDLSQFVQAVEASGKVHLIYNIRINECCVHCGC